MTKNKNEFKGLETEGQSQISGEISGETSEQINGQIPELTSEQTSETDPEVSLGEIRLLVRLVIWAALIGVGGWLTLPLPPVPISLQTFFIVMVGLVEGPKYGAMAVGLYLGAGLLGLPVFAGGVGGPSILFGPTAGFALAFPLAAAVAGLASRRRALELGKQVPGFWRIFFVSVFGSILLINTCGFLGLLVNTDLEAGVAFKVVLTFIPGGLFKCAAAASLASSRFFR